MTSATEAKKTLGYYYSYWLEKTPRRLLHNMAHYKFCANLIGKGKRVLDVGCNEGLGTYILAKHCGFARGVDLDEIAIKYAKQNWEGEQTEFFCENIFDTKREPWDAVTNFDVVEHIFPENVSEWWECMAGNLKSDGIAIIGTPSLAGKPFASDLTNKGHVNLYDGRRLEEEMREYFHQVFIFSANDEVVHTGFQDLAHYYLAVGCCPK